MSATNFYLSGFDMTEGLGEQQGKQLQKEPGNNRFECQDQFLPATT